MEKKLNKILERTVEIIAELTEQDKERIKTANTLEDLGVDSLMALELAVYLEREFDVYLSEEDLAKINTIKDILYMVGEKFTNDSA